MAGPAAGEPSVTTPVGRFSAYGYVEAYVAHNFGEPSNGITHARGFDNRHATFSLANAALGGQWEAGPVTARLVGQVGSTPATYYGAEPVLPGTYATNGSGPALWRFLQEAYVAYTAPVGRGLRLSAGLFLSPIGPENLAVHDNPFWSRSNLFFGLPFYHTGAQASYPLTQRLRVTAAVWNGWNSVVDNNTEKSVSLGFTYGEPAVTASLLYFGGVERAAGAPEGSPVRHLVDSHVTWTVAAPLSVFVHANAGGEGGRFGPHLWLAGQAGARLALSSFAAVAGRVDAFRERPAPGQGRPPPSSGRWSGCPPSPGPWSSARGGPRRSVSRCAATRPPRRCTSAAPWRGTAATPRPSCPTPRSRPPSPSA